MDKGGGIVPIIVLEGPKLSKEQKRMLVKEFTKIASEITRIPEQAFIVSIKENDQDNVGVGGVLLSERIK